MSLFQNLHLRRYGLSVCTTFTFFIISCIAVSIPATAQLSSDKLVGQKNANVVDSMKSVDYPYLLPIWGKKVYQKGFKLPKSAGLSAQYLWQQSDIIINNLQVGFNNGQKFPLDEIIRFNSAVATTNGANIRPDFWILPFLNVYMILAKSKSTTAIDAGVYLPDETGWKEVTSFKTKADFNATTAGFGVTPTFGVGGFFVALDFNFTWSDIDALDDPAYVFVFGPRVGKNIKLSKANPDRTVALWVGGFTVKMANTTNGSLPFSDLFPLNEWEQRINNGNQKVAENQAKVDNWWASLTPVQQQNPVNVAKHNAANRALATFGGLLDKASQVTNNIQNGSVQYSLDKKPKDMWNFLIGSQFQLNRDWMLRLEYGFLTSRQQLIAGVQYRFNF